MIPAVILAAGLSSRMGGRAKALLPLADGRTFIRAIVETFGAAGVDDLVVVLGHDAAAVVEHMTQERLNARWMVNEEYRRGQFSSVLTGLNAVDRPGVSAMLMTLVDVPMVSAATVRAVIDRFRATSAPIVRPVRGADHGHPVLIARSLFAALRAAEPSQGAKPIVRAHVSSAGDVPVTDPFSFRDVDTPGEYQQLLSGTRR